MDIKKLREPLPIEAIDFRIQSVNNGGYATILAYKDARIDMQRLDEVVGPLNWKREHTRDNHNCIVSIWDDEKKQWIGKEDTGKESNTEKEKGLASDSFKRACFNWGIGIELYDYPVISVKLNDNEWQKGENNKPNRATWNLHLKEWKWNSKFNDVKIVYLSAIDDKGNKRFEWSKTPYIKEKVNIDSKIKKDVFEQTLSCLENGDDFGLKEIWSEFGADEKAILWGMFNSQQRSAMKELMK